MLAHTLKIKDSCVVARSAAKGSKSLSAEQLKTPRSPTKSAETAPHLA